jgi:nucleotide-binding universal stress UspA family protein
LAPKAIISYDGTPGDHDALMLGQVLGDAGADLMLAYVRHAAETRRDDEALAEEGAFSLLAGGARWLEDPAVERRVVLSPSTGEGLAWLADVEQADMIVFGSEYRTAAGHVSPCRSAQMLLERGPAAIAIAPAAYHTACAQPIERIGILAGSADEAAIETAFSLADRLGATVVDRDHGVDLLLVGSRSEAPEGRVTLSSRSQNAIEEATSPVVVVARGAALHFETLVTA